jgi:hypothetical protein
MRKALLGLSIAFSVSFIGVVSLAQSRLIGPSVMTGPAGMLKNIAIAPGFYIDCMFTPSYNCTQLPNLFATDPYSTVGTFTGYADSSLRLDPSVGGHVWMVYSKPAVQASDGSLSVGNNLSWFDGTNWQFKSQIYASGQQIPNNHSTPTLNYTSNEVPALIPYVVGGVVYWFEYGLWYAVAPGQAGFNNQIYTNRIYGRGCAQSSITAGPSCLSSAATQFIGGNDVDAVNFPISQNFTTAFPQTSTCNRFDEPSLWMVGNTLYMTMGCSDPFQYTIYEFSAANPQVCVLAANCTWSYVANFVTAGESNNACAATFNSLCGVNDNLISACEMALSHVTGNPIMVCEMSTGNTLWGPIVFSMASLVPPVFNYSAPHLPVILYYSTCSQCIGGPEVGPGYEPTYPGGIVYTAQQTSCTPGAPGCGTTSGTFNQLIQTGQRP